MTTSAHADIGTEKHPSQEGSTTADEFSPVPRLLRFGDLVVSSYTTRTSPLPRWPVPLLTPAEPARREKQTRGGGSVAGAIAATCKTVGIVVV